MRLWRRKRLQSSRKDDDNLGEIAVERMRNGQIQDIFLKVEPAIFLDRLRHVRERSRTKDVSKVFDMDH